MDSFPQASQSVIRDMRAQMDSNHLQNIYGPAFPLDYHFARFARVTEHLKRSHSVTGPMHLFSSPGRTELGGNHTDHNHGKVLCAAVHLDTLAAVTPIDDGKIILDSEGFDTEFQVEIEELTPKAKDEGSITALIRGVADGLQVRGHHLGGFRAVVVSDVPVGSGLSSSASFEVLIGGILNELYNNGRIDPITLAQVGQYAENTHFGKPCGLMDQTACAVGGIMVIDLADPVKPQVRRIDLISGTGDYQLVVVATGDSHADLGDDYASIPHNMKQVARYLGGTVLRELDEDTLRSRLADVRYTFGDKTVQRALHFFAENRRVERMADALDAGNMDDFLSLVKESGLSSLGTLQNVIPPSGDGMHQSAALALSISNEFLESHGRGAARIHGGGFAGTIQAYIHQQDLENFKATVEAVFGADSVLPLSIRTEGVCQVGIVPSTSGIPPRFEAARS